MGRITIEPIGIIHSPYKKVEDIPCQGYRSKKKGKIEVYKKYEEGLKDVEGFSHLIILYLFHKAKRYALLAKPFLDNKPKGIFAIRGPYRPNHIGLSVVKLLEKKANILKVGNIDVLDGTPLLDIKPYVPRFDVRKNVRYGWLKGKL